MKSMMTTIKTLAFVSAFCFMISGCEKDEHKPPSMTLKTGNGYTSTDVTATKGQSIKVGITATKVEDDMLTYNVSYAYDGASTTNTLQTFNLTGSEQQNYDKDVTFTTRNQAGSEKWIFTITDKDGNIVQKQIVLTVQ